MPKFGQSEHKENAQLDMKAQNMSNTIFNTLQDCEKKLKFHISGGKNEAEKQIQKNVQ